MVVVVATHAGDGYVECLAAMPPMMVGGNAADVVLSGNVADNGDVTCDNIFSTA